MSAEAAVAASSRPGSGTAAPLLRISGLEKSYGRFQALCGVDLELARGERLVVCGPSGSGKSTLIRTINALESIGAGSIEVDGVRLSRDPRAVEAVRARVGMVFQSFNLFPHLTVLENCVLPLTRVKGLPGPEAEAQAMRYLEKVRIPEQATKHPAQLSGGQQQRVAIARAIAMGPMLLLCDEPTSALDPEMVKEVLDTLMGLAADGMTMVVVTHEMHFARRFATRVAFMDAGRIVEEADPESFFSAPRHERTREFLAMMG